MRPQLSWTGLWQGWLIPRTDAGSRQRQHEEHVLRQEMEAARREMEAAESYFQTVTEPELVDHAIFEMEAARRKYLYLFRRLRNSTSPEVLYGQRESEWM